MNTNDLPKGWKVGESVPHDQLYCKPPEFEGSSHLNVIGLRSGDKAHRLYTIPAGTPVAEVVRVFEVGSHGALGSSNDVAQTITLVADRATKIAEIFPCRVIFADAAGLKLKFERKITEEELKKIETLFPEDEAMQSGLQRYVSLWDGENALLAPVLKENLFHFWWD